MVHSSCLLLPLALLLCWKLLCWKLRGIRKQFLESLHPIRDAHHLLIHTVFVEFPFITLKSLEFGLLRTYAIPEISKILKQSNQFSLNPSKRYDDTQILIAEFTIHHVDGDRGSLALRRLNFLHSFYNIHNEEYLYVLSVFMALPYEWAAVYGHRPWNDAEKQAYFSIWHDIGVRMGITGIFESLEEARRFREEYETKHMVYSESNRNIADATMKLFLGGIPRIFRPLIWRLALSMMDERLLKSFGYERQPEWLEKLSHWLLKFFAGKCVRWFLPPRPLSWHKCRIPIGCPKFQANAFDPNAIYKLQFQAYKPYTYEDGYKIPELGSINAGGVREMKGLHSELKCPFNECINCEWPPSLLKDE